MHGFVSVTLASAYLEQFTQTLHVFSFHRLKGFIAEGSSSSPPQWVSNYDVGLVVRDSEIPMVRLQGW